MHGLNRVTSRPTRMRLAILALMASFAGQVWAQDAAAPTAPIGGESLPSNVEAAAAPAAEAPAAPEQATASPSTEPSTPLDEVIPFEEDEPAGRIESAEGDNLINVTVENETLENVVNMFARISGANIVTTSADLGGTVTVSLRGVAWKPALSSILDVHNLSLTEKMPGSGVYTIVPKPPDAQEPLTVQTLFLNFTTVADMSPMVRSMVGSISNSAVSDFPTRNAMVIKSTEANIAEIQDLVKQMDVPGRQVVVETKFIELSDSASKKLGIRWDSLDAWGTTLTLDPYNYARNITRGDNRTATDTSTDDRTEAYDESGNRLYDPRSVTFLDLDPENPDDGIIVTEVTDPSVELSRVKTTSYNDTYSKTQTEGHAALLEVDQFKAIISALNKTDGVSTISNPKLVVASGSPDAYFTVGEREPIIKVEVTKGTQDSPGDTITAQLDTTITTDYIKQGYLETGIHLQVVPVVKTDDLIEATITPKLIRRVLPDKVVGENSWPRIAVKQIQTTFTLRSGQTVAIGGLTDNTDDKKVSKIPLLGDIPLIGKYLFSHTAEIKSQVETVIFVTLSLAEADSLYREAGIPDEAELVHKQLIKHERRQTEFDEELESLRDASQEETAERARSRLLKRRK
jgi:type IV pilus assembly protein PilQ